MEHIEKIVSYEINNNQLILNGGRWGNIHIRPFSSSIINIELKRISPWSQAENNVSYSVVASKEEVQFLIRKGKNKIIMIMPKVQIEIKLDPFSISFYRSSKEVLLNQSVFKWDGWKVGFEFLIDNSDHFFGLGETDQAVDKIEFDHLGHKHFLWNKHLPAPARMIFPFIINPKGYGLFIDNHWPAEINMGSYEKNRFSYIAEGGNLNCYFLIGDKIDDILYQYSKLTGPPKIPPRFIFGMLQSKFGYNSRKEVESIASKYRRKKIPCDGIIIDLYWFNKMGDMKFNKKSFPEPKDMFHKLKKKGFNLILIEEPYVIEGSRLFEEGKRLEVFAKKSSGEVFTIPFWPGKSAIVDFTNPLAKQWWASQHYELIDYGVGGWWADLNEPEDHHQDMIHYAGPAAKVHNIFALEMQKSINLAYEQHAPNKRVFIMSRSGWAGMQRYGAGTWSGDVETSWEALSKQIAIGLNIGLVGIPYWNTDIGGFIGKKVTPELFIRWLQFGAFTPIMRPHGFQAEREPWSFGKEAEKTIIEVIKLRYSLIPYIYTLAYEAFAKGLPLMRPMIMYFPNDSNLINITDQFLFGKDLLVAPVTKEGAKDRVVYLPEGNWYDFWTNEKISGSQYIKAKAPLDRIPLFIKANTILPLLSERNYIDEKEWSELILLIYPETIGEYTLYEDDGKTNDYLEDQFSLTKFSSEFIGISKDSRWYFKIENDKRIYKGQVKKRLYKLIILTERKPKKVLINSKVENTWGYNFNEKILVVEIPLLTKENILMEVEFDK
ncbi:MAG: TIM-barrel domain-containing protein [Vulcanibacillus sp.]